MCARDSVYVMAIIANLIRLQGPRFVRVCESDRLCVLACTCVHECESAHVCTHHSLNHQLKEKIPSFFAFIRT